MDVLGLVRKGLAPLAAMFVLMLAGCAGTLDPLTVVEEIDDLPEPLHLELSKQDCFLWGNVPFTEVGYPDQYLPPGYAGGDASAVFGLPANPGWSNMGMITLGCGGDEPWTVAFMSAAVQPPNVDGIDPVVPTDDPSPTTQGGGFNFYALELYAPEPMYSILTERGWDVTQATIDVAMPTIVESPGSDRYYVATSPISFAFHDEDGLLGEAANNLEFGYTHRNFETRIYHEHSQGTGVLSFANDASGMLLGSGTCTYRADTRVHQIHADLPWLIDERPRTNGDCPDDTLGAGWVGAYPDIALLQDLPGVFAK